MLNDTGRLLGLYWLLDRREALRLSWPARILQILLLLILAAVSGFFGYAAGVWSVHSSLPVQIDPSLVPGFVLTFVMLTMVLVGTNQALRALFLSGDLDRLLATPVSPRAVMTAKLLSRLPSTVLLTFTIALPALVAFGIGVRLGPAYYPAAVTLVVVAPLFGLSVGALLSMALVRVIPARRMEEYLGAASILASIFFMILFQLPNLLRGRVSADEAEQAAAALQTVVDTSAGLPLPSFTAGRGLVELGRGQFLSGLGDMWLYLLATVGLFAAVVVLGQRAFLRTWLRVQGAGERRRTAAAGSGGLLGGRSVMAAIAVKDWLLRLREPRHMMSLATQVAALLVMAFVFLRPADSDMSVLELLRQGDTVDMPLGLSVAFSPGLFVAGGVVLVSWTLFTNLAVTALALEQHSFYLLKVAPIAAATVWRSKTLAVVGPAALLSTILFIGGWFYFRFELAWAPYGLLNSLVISALVISLNTAIGMVYPRLNWEDPRRMSSQRAGWYNLLGTAALLVVALPLATAPFVAAAIWPGATVLFMLGGLLLVGALAYGLIRLFEQWVERAWPGLGSSE